MNESTQYTKSNRRENLWVNFIFNLVLPILILRKGDDWFGESIGELASVPSNSSVVASILLSIAVLFPAGYGVSDFVRRKKYNFLSILGAVSALLTGGIGLVPGGSVSMYALKEAALPALLGILTLLTLNSQKPLVKMFLYNPDIFDVEKIEFHLQSNNSEKGFNQLLVQCTWMLAGTFLISAILNYILSRIVVVTEPFVDMNAFNDEIGVMMAWSFPVISLPCMLASGYAILRLTRGIHALTGLNFEDIVRQSRQSGP